MSSRLREHGYWRVLIRPTAFRSDLLQSLQQLDVLTRSCVVQLRGWDYPHWPTEGVQYITQDSIEGRVDWKEHIELWRMFKSAQFIHYFAMREDWIGAVHNLGYQPRTILAYESTVTTFTEIFAFASRLTAAAPVGPQTHIEISIFELQGRQLTTLEPNRVPFDPSRRADAGRFDFSQDYNPSDLSANATELALAPVFKLFELFKWTPALENLRQIQRQLRLTA